MTSRARPLARRFLAIAHAVFALAACGAAPAPLPLPPSGPPTPPPPPPPTGGSEIDAHLTSAFVWAGGTVEVRLRGLATQPATITFHLDFTPIPLDRVDAELWRGTVPTDARRVAGYPTLFLDQRGYRLDDYVRLLGRLDERVHPVGGSLGRAARYSIGTTAKLLVPTGAELEFLDLDAGSIITDPRLRSASPGGPGPTRDAHVWILQPQPNGPLVRWRIWPFLEQIDTVPRFGRPSFDSYALLDFEIVFGFAGDSGWVRELRHDGTHRTVVELTATGAKRLRISPDRRRAVLIANRITVPTGARYQPVGAPVLSLLDGSVVRTLAGASTIRAADFAPSGGYVAIATDDASGQPRRLRIETVEWDAIVHDTVLAHPIRAVAYDPYRPWFYVAAGPDGGPLELLVFRTTSYQLVGRMTDPCLDPCSGPMEIVPSLVDNVFVVMDHPNGIRAIRYAVPTVYDR